MTTNHRHNQGKKKGVRPENKLGIEEQIPTMPCVYNLNFRITRTSQGNQGYISYAVYTPGKKAQCPQCASQNLTFYDHYTRRFKDSDKEGVIRNIILKAKRYRCADCGRLFREPISDLLPKQRSTQRFRKRVAHEYSKNVNNKTIAKEFHISESTTERIIHEQFSNKIKEVLSYPCPRMIGIDEHTIHKKRRFATTICDLKNHRVYDIIEGKSRSSIESTLMSYKGREKVQMVCIDLSSSYRSLIRRCFPNAKIVADRFHVIRLINYHFMEFCKQAQEEVKWNRNLIYPLRKKTSNLNEHEKSNLKDFFKKNPGIESAYNFKENLCDLLRKKAQTASSCSRLIKQLKEMVSSMKYNSPVEFRRLAKTISDWFAPIIRMWRFTQNNGITEGFHRKMKLIQRRAYGFRNFANYRLRVLVECSGAEMKDLRDY